MNTQLTKNEFRRYFKRSTYELDPEDYKRLLPTEDESTADALNDIDELVDTIIKSKGVLFCIRKTSFGTKFIECKKPKISQEMDRLIDSAIFRSIYRSFPTHSFNPYVQLFLRNVQDKLSYRIPLTRDCPDEVLIQSVDKLNGFIDSIRKEAKSPEFKTTKSNYRRSSNDNYKNLVEYIEKLFLKHSRMMVLRIDFGYGKLYGKDIIFTPNEKEREEMYEQAVNDLDRLLRNRHKNKIFKHMVGYAWKLEYGLKKGFHYHMFFFYDAAKRWKDKYRAKKIGEYWQNNITKGKGLFHSCNANKDGYKYLGIGVINDDDDKLIEGLKKAAAYITKADNCNVRMIVTDNGRAFGKGEVKAKSKKGRPRVRPRVRANSSST